MELKVYLAGGMRTNWQQKVIDSVTNNERSKTTFFNPRYHGLELPKEYTIWDLFHIKESHIVFAYMEESNPSGMGLALEIGYAVASGKTVILVDEKSSKDEKFSRYFAIVRESSALVCNSLEEGIMFLNNIINNG